MADKSNYGMIFDIQHYSIHDGPGIRSTVFLNGCPLKCIWCQNPESQSHRPSLFYYSDRCSGCGCCKDACPDSVIEIINGKSVTDRSRCNNCGDCVLRCPNDARVIKGETLAAEAVFDEVKKDSIFYQNSQGGVTISGGDPVAQPGFVRNLGRLCRQEGIHVALETCGYAPWKTIEAIVSPSDLVLFDFKHMDACAHKTCTGVNNERILENAQRIYHELKKPIHARVPVVPGYNASCDNIKRLATFIINQLGRDVEVHLLPYHPFGRDKYKSLEMSYPGEDISPPTDTHMQTLLAIIEEIGLMGRIGG